MRQQLLVALGAALFIAMMSSTNVVNAMTYSFIDSPNFGYYWWSGQPFVQGTLKDWDTHAALAYRTINAYLLSKYYDSYGICHYTESNQGGSTGSDGHYDFGVGDWGYPYIIELTATFPGDSNYYSAEAIRTPYGSYC
jgi:hypothetical protein